MGKDERGRGKANRQFYAGNPLQQCQVCGRLFVKRKDKVCSVPMPRPRCRKEGQCRGKSI